MPNKIENSLKQIVNSLIAKYQPEKIILFGSRAKGTSDQYSDLDLIIIKKTNERFIERLIDPVLLKILPIKTDVFVYNPEEFTAMKKNENPFILSALKNSKVLYEKP